MAALANEGKAKLLAVELKQIIHADRMASDIIGEADSTKAAIEKAAEKQQAEILADAERRRQEMEAQVKAEQAEALEKRKGQTEEEFRTRRDRLTALMDEKRDGWIEEIVQRVTAP